MMTLKFSERWPIVRAWRFFIGIGFPIVLSPMLFLGGTMPFRAAYIVIVMAVFWMSEVLPIAVTALMPLVFFPLMDIQSTETLCNEYMKDSIMVFVGGLFLALAFEYSNLHKRIALRVMLFTGASIGMLMLGVMLTTMFLSMWMFNTATTAMMIPIILAVLEELQKSLFDAYDLNDPIEASNNNGANGAALPIVQSESGSESAIAEGSTMTMNTDIGAASTQPLDESETKVKIRKSIKEMKTMFLLSTCYASNIGGTGVITGSGTNLVALEFLGQLDEKHHGDYAQLTFANWMAFNALPMLIAVFVAWIYLQCAFLEFPNKYKFWKSGAERSASNSLFTPEIEGKIKKVLEDKFVELGGINCHEKLVLGVFLFAVASWMLHEPKFIPGWSSWFEGGPFVSISTSSLLVLVMVSVIPRDAEFYQVFQTGDFTGVTLRPLLDFDFAMSKFPWGVIILLGGGYAMSNGAKKAGLAHQIGQFLAKLRILPPSAIQFIVMTLIAFMTEVTSNTATATIVVPILVELSRELNIHPLYFALPATVTCSYAFMLPVATPPNAIVYAASDMKVTDMIKTGLFMNCACILILYGTTNLVGDFIFHFSEYKYIE